MEASRVANPRVFGLIDDLQEELTAVLGRPVHITELIDPSPAFAAEVERDAVTL